jgi:Cu/Zn superoxide dismutase
VVVVAKNDDTMTRTVHLPGYRLQGPAGAMGRAVIVHAGASGPLEAQAGIPNNRIACGVIAPAVSLF